MHSRRTLISTITLGSVAWTLTNHAASQEAGPPLPNPSAFETGDLVWPKKPGVFVPYDYSPQRSPEADAKQWYAERDSFISRLTKNKGYFSERDIAEIKSLDYREFYARYAGDQRPGSPGTYSSGGAVYVGHVGIIEIDEARVPWIIEAILGKGIVRFKYEDWIHNRPGEIVWHGRVRDLPAHDRAKIVGEAKKHIGRPYDFWNFNLDDASAFYCSKLVWLCIWRALNFPIDGNSNPKRIFWFSPKQLLYARTIVRLHDPGPYAHG